MENLLFVIIAMFHMAAVAIGLIAFVSKKHLKRRAIEFFATSAINSIALTLFCIVHGGNWLQIAMALVWAFSAVMSALGAKKMYEEGFR